MRLTLSLPAGAALAATVALARLGVQPDGEKGYQYAPDGAVALSVPVTGLTQAGAIEQQLLGVFPDLTIQVG